MQKNKLRGFISEYIEYQDKGGQLNYPFVNFKKS